ncbi:MAG: hypothetical protein ABI227_00170 [Rhodanobacter sp.]
MLVKSPIQHQRRLADLHKRLIDPQDAYERCRIYPCTHRTTADRGEGLNRLYCRRHIEFYRRHGSYTKRSYGAGDLRPHRMRAMAWLQAQRDAPEVRSAIEGVRRLYRAARAPIEAFRLAGMSPAGRAKVIWAQLRQREVDPLQVLAAWLAVDTHLRDDPQPDRHEEYRHVQVAKLVHRMAGGTHKRWERERADGRVEVTQLHKHPISRGQVLRVLGREIEKACSGLAAEC